MSAFWYVKTKIFSDRLFCDGKSFAVAVPARLCGGKKCAKKVKKSYRFDTFLSYKNVTLTSLT